MTTLTNEQIDAMSKAELHKAAKARAIKYGKLSLMQIREALKAAPALPEKVAKPVKGKSKKPAKKAERKERTGTKMVLAIKLMEDNKSLPRKAIIKLFMDKAKLTKAGASTYYSLIQKKLAK